MRRAIFSTQTHDLAWISEISWNTSQLNFPNKTPKPIYDFAYPQIFV